MRIQPGDRTVTAETILVATGGRPVVPDLPGAGHAITSNEAFHLEALPSSIVIVGGGYIAVEFAGIFNGLGAETTLLYRGEKILRGFDEDLRDALTQELLKRGIDVRCNARIASIEKGWSSHTVTLEDGSTLEADKVMFATGRTPNTAGIGLEAAGVKLGERGEIVVDEQSRSSVDNIYAVGDVTDRVNLTPVAIREGHAFADTRVRQASRATVDHELIPTGRVRHARDRHRRPARAHGPRAPRQGRHLQGQLPPAQEHRVGPRRAHADEAGRRRRDRPRRSAATCWGPTPPRSCRWRPSPCA